MADPIRIKDFTQTLTAGELQTFLSELMIAVDKGGTVGAFLNAKKMPIDVLLSSLAVTSTTNNYQALTPRGFYSSLATEAVKGIVELASDAEILARTESTVLTCAKVDKIGESMHRQTGTIDITDIDPSSSGLVNSSTLVQYRTGNIVRMFGLMSIKPNGSAQNKIELNIANIGVPSTKQGLSATIQSGTGELLALGCVIEAYGSLTRLGISAPLGNVFENAYREVIFSGSYLKVV